MQHLSSKKKERLQGAFVWSLGNMNVLRHLVNGINTTSVGIIIHDHAQLSIVPDVRVVMHGRQQHDQLLFVCFSVVSR